MKCKKLLAAVLSVMLVVLSGCGSKPAPTETTAAETFPAETQETAAPIETTELPDGPELLTVLTAEDAILTDAMDAYYQEDDEYPYITNVTENDPIMWRTSLPKGGSLQFVIEYSTPDASGETPGWLLFARDGVVCDSLELILQPTMGGMSYDTYTAEIELSAGPIDIAFYSNDLPEGQEFFVNLRQIGVWLAETDGTEMETVPGEHLEGISGWWVRPEGYEPVGLSLMDYFYISEDLSTCTIYNVFGEPGDELGCLYDGYSITIDLIFDLTQFWVKEGTMVSPDSNEVAFVHVSEPEFRDPEIEMDGRWYRCGDPDGDYYEFDGRDFKKVRVYGEETYTEYEGSYTLRSVYESYGDYDIPDVTKLDTGEFEKNLTPSMRQAGIFFEEDGTTDTIYVHEDSIDGDMELTYDLINEMMEMDIRSEIEEGRFYQFWIQPNCFVVTQYEVDAEGNYEQVEGGRIYGNWEIVGTEMLEFWFENGNSEIVIIDEEDGEFFLGEVGEFFMLDPIF